ncbi:nucleotidyltransferase family protein [Polaromonas sp. OV174]|uniref:nucleotidyltransferase family protein n=1 Tax=Polaromonas sp. OV174 TaxID=1855300 RepID=UPI000B81E92A
MKDRFFTDVLRNPHNRAILERWDELALLVGWLVASCLFQTVWNVQSECEPEAAIKDYDLFYFDPSDTSEADIRTLQQFDQVRGLALHHRRYRFGDDEISRSH